MKSGNERVKDFGLPAAYATGTGIGGGLPAAYGTGMGIGGGLLEADGNEADWFSPRPEEGASEWLRCKTPRVKPKATQQIGFHHAPKKGRQNG